MTPQELFDRLASAALAHYNLDVDRLTFLRHSDALTYRVEDAHGRRYLLRLHQPAAPGFDPLRLRAEALESELCYTEALASATGLPLQRPLRNQAGAAVTTIPSPADAGVLHCTLLTWVEGEPLSFDAPGDPRRAASLGALLARMHRFAMGWQPPEGFVRPSYDERFLARVAEGMRQAPQHAVLGAADMATIERSLAEVQDVVGPVPADPQRWGMIHADLHPGNCLRQGARLIPIDFSLSGCGAYLLDLATTAGSLDVALRPALIDAYTHGSGLDELALRTLEAWFIAGRMSYYGFALHDPAQRDWLRRRIPEVVAAICRPFLEGRHFLFDAR